MPVVRTPISANQLAELLGVDAKEFLGVEMRCDREYQGWAIVTEGCGVQTTGEKDANSQSDAKRIRTR
jgi:hypothetical protein